ncbi:MAG: hypothetical protein KAT28_00180 [Candidatus Aenigmarchaeota archaeon]|nr:hypothetical protein [Candidatus Aenigmarchaeota archaeon]
MCRGFYWMLICILSIITTSLGIGIFLGGTGIYFAGFAISIFFLSLVIMNYMSYISKMVLEDGKKKVKNLKENAKDNKDDIEQLEMKLKELEKLPVADRVAMFFPERIGVLDRHEIRRALMITFTIVYLILLFTESLMMEYINWVYLSMISFYFGSRSLEKYAEARNANKK